MTSLARQFRLVYAAGVVYMLFVAGGVIPVADDDSTKAAVKGILFFAVALTLFSLTVRLETAKVLGTFLLVALPLAIVGLLRTSNLIFAIEKIDGAIVCPVIIVLIIDRVCTREGAGAFRTAFLLWALGVLFATLLYKIQFGLFDRQVRFLFNGPIVFGWLMGLCAMLSLHAWHEIRERRWLLALALFLCAILWTESKGPAVAFAVAFCLYVLTAMRGNWRFWIGAALLLILVWIFFSDAILDLFQESRFSAVARLLTGELAESDDGSVGIRGQLSDEAMRLFLQSPFAGIGLGNFSFEEFVYPHNEHLEIFTELGGAAGVVHLAFLAFVLRRASPSNLSLLALFGVAAAFSGDVSYLRFLYAFGLLTLLSSWSAGGMASPTVHENAHQGWNGAEPSESDRPIVANHS